MILEWLKTAVEGVDGLSGKCFPPGVLVAEADPPVVVCSLQEENDITDLAGNVHHTVSTVDLDIFAETSDETWSLYQAIKEALRACGDQAVTEQLWIFSVECQIKEADVFLPELELRRRTMTVTVYWCEI